MASAPSSAAQAVLKSWTKSLSEPERRAAFYALCKSLLLIAALAEYVWLWHTKFYSKHFPEAPLSIAWALLTVIAGTTFGQIGISAVLKYRTSRLRKYNAEIGGRLTEMLSEYISNGHYEDELNRFADHSTEIFEECVTSALLNTRGAAHERLCELPAMAILRDRWIASLHNRDERDRRYAVEHLALLRDPQATLALEYVLDDACAGVVAAAIRGLLRMTDYSDRDALLRSIPTRPYLVQVLAAGESPAGQTAPILTPVAVNPREKLTLRLQQLQMRVQAVGDAVKRRQNKSPLISCSVLAASGAKGRGVLHSMSAEGANGDAPAEALGGILAAAARGGRT